MNNKYYYLIFAIFFAFSTFAQSPGGIGTAELKLWVKSDDAGNIATAWKDHSPNNNPVENTGVTLAPADAAHNFHPFTTGFSAANRFHELTSFAASGYIQTPVAFYSAARPTSLANGRIIGMDDDANASDPGLSMRSTGVANFYKYWGTAAIWKVQNTGGVGTVTVAWTAGIQNLHIVKSDNPTIDTEDQFIPMTDTVTVNGVVYNTTTVTFNDGDYFAFAGLTTGPGGVSENLVVWFKADGNTINTTTNGAAVTSWANSVPGAPTANLPVGGYIAPTFINNIHNFNPAIQKTTPEYYTGLRAENVFTSAAARELTMYSVTSQPSFPNTYHSGVGFYDGLNTSDNPQILRWGSQFSWWHASSFGGTSVQTVANMSSPIANYPYINGLTKPNTNAYDKKLLKNGYSFTTDSYYAGTVSPNFHIWQDNDSYGFGTLPETFAFDRVITVAERNRVESYLAIKYGITLKSDTDNSNAPQATRNYVNSSSEVVWNISANASFNYNVFGIARDNSSALHQKVSRSENNKLVAGSVILTVSTTNDFTNPNADISRASLNDQQFLMFGDNNNTSTDLVAFEDCPGIAEDSSKIVRTWLVQNKGNVENVWLEINLSAYDIRSEVFLIVGDGVDESGNVIGNAYIVPGTFDDATNKALFNVSIPDGKYFSVGGKTEVFACETCVGGQYTLRNGSVWNTSALRIADDTGWFTYGTDQEDTTLQARHTVEWATASNEWVDQWYPWPYGNRALLYHLGTNGGESSKVVYKTELNKAGKVAFELSGISQYYDAKIKVVVRGFCGTKEVMPVISPKVTGPYSVYNSYIIDGNTVTGNARYMWIYNYATVKVNFNRPVERIEIEYIVERTSSVYTGWWLTIGDMTVECGNAVEPNQDNVFVKQSFDNEIIEACNEAEMRMNIINNNCDDRVVNITDNTLPSGLEYIPDSYSGIGTPVFNDTNTNFTLSETFPVGETNLYVKVRSTDPSAVTSDTVYSTQSTYLITIASGGTGEPYLSDNLSSDPGLNPTLLTLTPGTPLPMPEMTFTSDANQNQCGEINYTITFDNNTGNVLTGLQLQPVLNIGQIINGSISLNDGITGTVNPQPTNGEMTFFIPDLSIPVGISTITFKMDVTRIDEHSISIVELYYDPSVDPCAISSKVVADLDKDCITCIGGKGFFDMNNAWLQGGATARSTNEISNIVIGNPTSGELRADARVTYPNATTEWHPNYFPRQNGRWTELSRYDNLNGAAGVTTYEVNLKDVDGETISAKPSFQIAGMTKISGQEDIVSVKGYCGTNEVLPKLLYAYNSTPAFNDYYRRFTIDEETAVATGTKPYYDYYDIATMNVEFEEFVDRVVIEWSVNRAPVYQTLGFLYISDMNFVCANRPLPNPDDIFIITSALVDTLPTCEDALIKLNIKNWNCDPKTINISNTLPAGLEYVADSYVGLGQETPTYGGQSFTLNSLEIPSGNSYVYIKVKSIANATATHNLFYQYTVEGRVNEPSPYRSDDDTNEDGYQDVVLNYTASTLVDKPTIVKAVDKCFKPTSNGNGTELTYTITVNNPASNPINNVELMEILDGGQELVAESLVNPFGGTENDYATEANALYISGMTIPPNTVDAVITFKVLTKDTTEDILNVVSMTVDPESECANANQVLSNELTVLSCTFCTSDALNGTPDTFGKVGITTQTKQAGWPENVANGALVLESSSKGFVITRLTTAQRDAIAGANLVEGMFVYVTDANGVGDGCFQLYNGTEWKCIERDCNE